MNLASQYLLTFLLNSLWQISLVAMLAALVSYALHRGPAIYRQIVWVSALIAALLLPLISLRKVEVPPPSLGALFAAPAALPLSAVAPAKRVPSTRAVTTAAAPADTTRIIPVAPKLSWLLMGGYALLLALRIAMLARAWSRTLRLRRTALSQDLPPAIDNVKQRCLRAFGLQNVELRWSNEVTSPVTAGAWRRIVILPQLLFTETSEDVLATAIGHELAHVARRDFASNVFYELISLAAWFQPGMWIIRRGIARSREMACDELVAARLMDPRAYAESLVKIATTMSAQLRPGYALSVFDGDIFEERIRRLLAPSLLNLKQARLVLATGMAALAICIVMASGLAVSARAQSQSRAEMQLAADAYNARDFKTAVEHFQNAVRIEPSNISAKLFLGNALISQLAAEGSHSGLLLDAARQQYGDVLATNSASKLAMQGLLMVASEAHRPAEAHEWAIKLIQLDPKDKTAYFNAGVVDWTMVFPEMMRAGGGGVDMRIADDGKRAAFREKFQPQVDEGIRMLEQSLQIDPNYSEAIAYLNMLNLTKSSMVDSLDEAARYKATADGLRRRMVPFKRDPGQPLNIDAPPAAANPAMFAPPPPPPPPPPSAGGALIGLQAQSRQLPANETRPEAIHREKGELTAAARAAKYQGTCVVSVTIDVDGNVQNPEIIGSAEYGLGEVSLEAAKKWKFRPATRDGKPIAVKAQIEMTYRAP